VPVAAPLGWGVPDAAPLAWVLPVAAAVVLVVPAVTAFVFAPPVREWVLAGAWSAAKALGQEAANRAPITARMAIQQARPERGSGRWLRECDGKGDHNLLKADPEFPLAAEG
jgi:hypothetical protein